MVEVNTSLVSTVLSNIKAIGEITFPIFLLILVALMMYALGRCVKTVQTMNIEHREREHKAFIESRKREEGTQLRLEETLREVASIQRENSLNNLRVSDALRANTEIIRDLKDIQKDVQATLNRIEMRKQ